MRDYRLISADSHVNEPPDLWQTRVATKLRGRAPRVERFPEGDAWILEGVADPVNFGWNACAGLDPATMKGWARYEDLRAGGHDPKARLAEMDRDRVDAEVLYPTPRLSQAILANTDVELHVACVRAYNDWLFDHYVAQAPDRFAGLALLPNVGVDAAVAELDRLLGRPGMRGVLIGAYPNGSLEPKPEDDRVWARLVEAGIPLDIHVSMGLGMPSAHRSKLPGFGRFYDAPNRMVQMLFSGMLDRFPTLPIVFAEVDCGWVPYVKEQIDNNYLRLAPAMGYQHALLPSEYFERHFHFSFISDATGIDNRQRIGVERMLWSSDYPHISADWPHSWRTIEAAFSGVPRAERDLILAGNAKRLYGFGR
ncbi:MAG: amidohydrolase family protein [Myxococcota bacterium]